MGLGTASHASSLRIFDIYMLNAEGVAAEKCHKFSVVGAIVVFVSTTTLPLTIHFDPIKAHRWLTISPGTLSSIST